MTTDEAVGSQVMDEQFGIQNRKSQGAEQINNISVEVDGQNLRDSYEKALFLEWNSQRKVRMSRRTESRKSFPVKRSS